MGPFKILTKIREDIHTLCLPPVSTAPAKKHFQLNQLAYTSKRTLRKKLLYECKQQPNSILTKYAKKIHLTFTFEVQNHVSDSL
jgi:hypothetical protein